MHERKDGKGLEKGGEEGFSADLDDVEEGEGKEEDDSEG